MNAEEETFRLILPGLPNLQSVHLTVADGISRTLTDIPSYLSSCPRLESVWLERCPTAPAEAILRLALACPLMRQFVFDQNEIFFHRQHIK